MSAASLHEGWGAATAYENYMGRWSRQLAPQFLTWLDQSAGQRWLDVGCGTGALSEAILARHAPRALSALDPAEGFLRTARLRLPETVRLLRATAERLALADASVDASVSLLVLNFVANAPAALREMARVTAPGGTVAAAVWDYAGKLDLTRHYWDAARSLGLLAPGQDQGERFALCSPSALRSIWETAGLQDIHVSALELSMHFVDFEDYWQPFLGGQGSAPAHAVLLENAARERLRETLRQRLPAQADGAIVLSARAWTVRGRVGPGH